MADANPIESHFGREIFYQMNEAIQQENLKYQRERHFHHLSDLRASKVFALFSF
jgi:hypothetical protein